MEFNYTKSIGQFSFLGSAWIETIEMVLSAYHFQEIQFLSFFQNGFQ